MKVYIATSGDGPYTVDGAFDDWNKAVKAVNEWHFGVDVELLRQSKTMIDGKTVWATDMFGGPRITQLDLS